MSKCEEKHNNTDCCESQCEIYLEDWCDDCFEKKHHNDAFCDVLCDDWFHKWCEKEN